MTARTRRGLTRSAAAPLLILLAPGGGIGRAGADGIMLLPPGAFWMGRDDGDPDERPLHRVFVRDFWLDRHKVTNREVALFLEARGVRSAEALADFDVDDPAARMHRRGGRFTADPGFEDHPAVEVSWYGARDYCLWRGRRLPTEAEWEKAARGPDRRRYPWGDAPPGPGHAVFGRPPNATDRGIVAGRAPGPTGVEDLLGNLREWTASEHRPYPYRRDDGRETAALHAPRVIRGASHDDPPETLRVTIRRSSSYDGAHRGLARGHHHVGFRCATSEDLGGY